MQTIVYQCDTAMPAQKLPNCCINTNALNAVILRHKVRAYIYFRTLVSTNVIR